MLIFKYMKINVISNMEYPLATYFTLIARMLGIVLEVIGLFFLFDRFNSLLEYSFYEVGLCYLVIRFSYAAATCFGKGYQSMGKEIQNGGFDSILIKPRSLILQSFGWALDLRDIGVSIQYIIMLILFIGAYAVNFTLLKAIVLILMMVCGTTIFLGIFMLSASVSFYTIKNAAMESVFTDGGVQLGSYPLTIYYKWITRFFTFIVPFGCANYLPVLYITDKVTNYKWLYMISPVLGMLFILPCALIWLRAAKNYSSTGS